MSKTSEVEVALEEAKLSMNLILQDFSVGIENQIRFIHWGYWGDEVY